MDHKLPFEMGGRGWGYFTISALLALKTGYCWVSPDATVGADGNSLLPLEWRLDFEKELSFVRAEVGIAVQ